MNRIFIVLLSILSIFSANADTLKGKVADNDGHPIEYATIVALKNGEQFGGTTTDSLGVYRLELPVGKYIVNANSVGYEPISKEIRVTKNTVLDLTMKLSGVMMQELNVEASAIRREADRFVMMVEDMPSAIGKDAQELIKDAPGVWINDDKISVNGKQGTKIYVNDREMRLDNEQMQAFLKSLRAEDIKKVEVIPEAGVEYSASSSAGIIKLTLKKNRTDGIMGSVSIYGDIDKNSSSMGQSASLNIKNGKWSYNLNENWDYTPYKRYKSSSNVTYDNGDFLNSSNLNKSKKFSNGNIMAGVFYDINAKNTIGAEVTYQNYDPDDWNYTNSHSQIMGIEETSNSVTAFNGKYNYVNATLNYFHTLDTIGSTLKFITDYSKTKNSGNNFSTRYNIIHNIAADSTYRNASQSDFDVTNISLDLDKHFNPKWSLATGAKYTFNRLNSSGDFEYNQNDKWNQDPFQNYKEDYKENILGLYAKGSAKFGRFLTTLGLRAEYIKTTSKGSILSKEYFDVFPNGSLTYLFDSHGANSVSLSYYRHVSRPSFWMLNPEKRQSSDNFYTYGNPNLEATMQNSFNATFTYKYRYSLSAWAGYAKNPVLQNSITDPENPERIINSWANGDNQGNYGISLYLPFQITEWWNLNANLSYMFLREKTTIDAEDYLNNNLGMINLSTDFQLPLDFYLSLSYSFQSKYKTGNFEIDPMHFLYAKIKKSFAKKRWTASFSANNILVTKQKMKNKGNNYINSSIYKLPISFSLSLRYNFNVGEMFKTRSIEKNADESRLQQAEINK